MKKFLAILAFSVACTGFWLAGTSQVQTVKAQKCTKAGKSMSASDGTLICDCTATGSPSCNCIVPCSGGGEAGEEEILN
jgi:hypothetical protein